MTGRRRIALAVGGLGLAAITYGVAVTTILVGAARASHAGEHASSRATKALTPKGILDGRPLPDLARAEREYRRAANLTGSVVLLPLRVTPFAGRQIVAIRGIVRAAADAARAAHRAGTDARALLGPKPAVAGPERVRLLTALATIADRARHEIDATDLGPRQGLLPPIARAHNRLAERFNRADDALGRGVAAARATAEMLQGPRRFLLVAANNSEMRAGSGMWLQGGELTAVDGVLHINHMRSLPDDAPVPPDAVAPEGDFAARWGYLHPGREWRNLMLSPRFDVSAQLAARMWEAAGNPPVDGVICIDPLVLEAILHATGPVQVGDKKIRAGTVVNELLHDQYLKIGNGDRALSGRRERLGELAGATFAALETGGWDVAKLARDLGQAAAGRHLMIWSKRPEEESAWVQAGLAGTLTPDSLAVAVENRGGNKLDHFLHVDVGVATRRAGPDDAVTLTVRLRNDTPAGEPLYIAGLHPESGAQPGDYVGIVAVTMPAQAKNTTIDGVTGYAVLGPDGPTQVMAIGVTVPMGGRSTVVGHFTVPRKNNQRSLLTVGASARLPVITWRAGSAIWRDRGPHSLPLP